jgi:hypothetical protein
MWVVQIEWLPKLQRMMVWIPDAPVEMIKILRILTA